MIRALTAQGHKPAGPPFGRYERTDSGFFVVAGFPSPAPITAVGRVEADSLPGGPAARAPTAPTAMVITTSLGARGLGHKDADQY